MNFRIVNDIRNYILMEIQDLQAVDQKAVIQNLLDDFQKMVEHL